MANEFEFKLPNGVTVRTGNIAPEVKPLGNFQEYPKADLMSDDDIRAILSNPKRKRSRYYYNEKWILNQGQRSSCNAYACGGALMRLRHRKGLKFARFAPEFLYMHINDAQDRGSMLDDGMVAGTNLGMCLEGTVPYQSYRKSDLSMEQLRFATQQAKHFRYLEAYELPTGTIEELWRAAISAVLRREQLVLALHVGTRYMNSPTGNWAQAGFDRGKGNHAVGADDAIASKDWRSIMDIRIDQYGSWGTSHGQKGRVLIGPHHLQEPSNYHVMYAIRSVITNKEV
jgi:hypothetical protein